ncbi:leucine efflux protein LeuE [Micromonospora sp. NPDC049559]|uniref:leucine efflux protein LeuE n=1 Tax=Micromonospora sp. NPDC049559 TaxID=3155923 RepID=UPI00342ECEBF
MMAHVLGTTNISTYVLGTIAIILLPGPNSLFVLSTAARLGVRAGYRAAAGVFLGDSVIMVLSAAGVASLLRTYPPLFLIVKYAGAAYLGYLGLRMLRGAWQRWRARGTAATTAPPAGPALPGDAARSAAAGAVRSESSAAAGAAEPGRDPFRRALVISLLNPKAILFFISFFIQFVDPSYPYPALSFLVLGVIAQITSLLYLTTLIFGGSYLAAQFRQRRRLAAAMTTAVGALFVGFGLKLATASLG